MSRSYLFGPVTPEFSDNNLRDARRNGSCQTFSMAPGTDFQITEEDNWDSLSQLLPNGGDIEAICLWLGYARIPVWLWSAPVPIIGLAPDWNLLWHYYQLALPQCDLVITDSVGVEKLRQAGCDQLLDANLFGLGHQWFDESSVDLVRDIDISFVGNLNPDVHSERASWLMRLARHSGRRNVVIRTGIFGIEYRNLLRRSRIVFNRSIRGECNCRTLEALAAGALLFSETGNHNVNRYLQPDQEYVAYSPANLDDLLDYYLDHEEERLAFAAAGQAKARGLTFDAFWSQTWQQIGDDWPRLVEQSRRRKPLDSTTAVLMHAYQEISHPTGDANNIRERIASELIHRPNLAELPQAMAALTDQDPPAAVASLRRARACSSRSFSIGADLATELAIIHQRDEAISEASAALREVAFISQRDIVADFVPPNYGRFHVTWERCGWTNPNEPRLGIQHRLQWAQWRLHSLLADLTGEMCHYHEAVIAMTDQPSARAALGCALARAGRSVEALTHLKEAYERNPFDRAAARALFQLLGDLGDSVSQRRLARDLWQLAAAVPQIAPLEPWFSHCPPPGDELVSIIIPCCNNVALTRECIDSVLRHSRAPFELILIDNGSTDGTAQYFAGLRPQGHVTRIDVITNTYNRGFPTACNQGLMRSAGEYIVFLNNDTIVTADWLKGLVNWSIHQWPRVGLVGAVTNYAPAPQYVPVTHGNDMKALDSFARSRREKFAGQALEVGRVSGFCILARRDVLKRVGGFDERFGIGFFDDDDLGIRVREAGFKLIIALDVFIHHHGSRTFRSLGVDTNRLLAENFEQFRIKWGAERTAGYRAPTTALLRPPRESDELVPAPLPVRAEKAKVSLCMIVRNEETNLTECLKSVDGLFDEIVIVDTGSTDRTKEIAVELGANVFDFPWIDDFATARNESLNHATGDYIFWMDADDRLDPNDRDKTAQLLGSINRDNCAFVLKCVCTPRSIGESATVVDHVRLFRNLPAHRWKYRVHEQILPALRASGAQIQWTDIHIHHVGYHDPALRSRKLERDLKILQAEHASNSDDPFTLFNLGSVYQELDRCREALPILRKSLELSHPADSIVRKLFALIIGCHRRLNQLKEAAAAVIEGLSHYPQDAELLFMDGVLRREQGDVAGAESSWLKLLSDPEGSHFASIDAGLRGPKARHNLAILYYESNRLAEAEAQWRAALSADPSFVGGWLGLGELYLRRKRWADVSSVINSLEGEAGTGRPVEAGLLRGRMNLARKEFAAAKWTLSQLIEAHPLSIEARALFSHVLLQEGKDHKAAEAALNDVLQLDPNNREAKHNLAVLKHQQPEINRT